MNSTLIRSPVSAWLRPYAAPAASTSAATWPWAPAATVMLRNPGPAMSTAAIPAALRSRSATSSANARGLVPAFFPSWSATLVA